MPVGTLPRPARFLSGSLHTMCAVIVLVLPGINRPGLAAAVPAAAQVQVAQRSHRHQQYGEHVHRKRLLTEGYSIIRLFAGSGQAKWARVLASEFSLKGQAAAEPARFFRFSGFFGRDRRLIVPEAISFTMAQ